MTPAAICSFLLLPITSPPCAEDAGAQRHHSCDELPTSACLVLPTVQGPPCRQALPLHHPKLKKTLEKE